MIKQFIRIAPPKIKSRIVTVVRQFPIVHKLLRWYDQQYVDVYLISFPKCGRTWLRLMLGKALALHLGLEDTDLLDLRQFSNFSSEIPRIKIDHDHDVHFKTPDELSTTKTDYAGKRVILLIRDVRDVVVSAYFEYTKRRQEYGNKASSPFYGGDLSSFLRHQTGSVDTFIRFYNIWADNRYLPADFMLIRYEDMHTNPTYELRRVLEFLGMAEINDEIVRQAVEYSRFDHMRELERKNALNSPALKSGDKDDPESYKTRKGKVGGFVDYLSEADISYLNQKVAGLSNFYGYTK